MSCIWSRFDGVVCQIRDNIASELTDCGSPVVKYCWAVGVEPCSLPAIERLRKLNAALTRLHLSSLRIQYRLDVLLFISAQDLNAKSMSLFPPLPQGGRVITYQL